jgi:membrane associated rhomboid family serine protease
MYHLGPVTRNLLLVNIAIFIIGLALPKETWHDLFTLHLPVLPNSEDPQNPYFKIWQVFTHMFLHADIGHLLSNMLGLYFFGSALESYMGGKKFLSYYVLCGLGAAICQIVFNYYNFSELTEVYKDNEVYAGIAKSSMLGASGAIMGILMAFGYLFPNVEMMLLFFPVPIKAKYMVVLYGLYDLVQGTRGAATGVAHFAHLGGLLFGFILLYFFKFSRRG